MGAGSMLELEKIQALLKDIRPVNRAAGSEEGFVHGSRQEKVELVGRS